MDHEGLFMSRVGDLRTTTATMEPDPIDWADIEGTPCLGHGYMVDDTPDMDLCNGSCLTPAKKETG